MKITEIAFGLEKQWNKTQCRVVLVPHHLSFVSLIAGILCASTLGSPGIKGQICLIVSSILILGSLCLHLVEHKPKRSDTVVWMVSWMLLWGNMGILVGQPPKQPPVPIGEPCAIHGRVLGLQPGSNQITAQVVQYRCHTVSGRESFDIRMRITPEEAAPETGLVRGTEFVTSGSFRHFESPDVPGMFDSQSWARTQGIVAIFSRHAETQKLTIVRHPTGVMPELELERRKAWDILRSHSSGGLLPALVLGASRDISDETRTTFAKLGIAHVIAVSGLHFGMVALVLSMMLGRIANLSPWILRRFGRRRFAVVVSIPVLFLYLLFVGAPVSAQRSFIMMAICCLAHLFCRKSERTRSLAIAGTIILLIDPKTAFSIGFQLSFSAILGIIWGMNLYESSIHLRLLDLKVSDRLRKLITVLCSMCMMTLSTSVTTAPFVIAHFGILPVSGIAANLLVIPYVSFILMPIAMITALVLIIGLPCASVLTAICGYAETILLKFAELYTEYIPLTHVELPPHPIIVFSSVLTAFALLFHFKPSKTRLLLTAAICLVNTVILSVSAVYPRIYHLNDDLRISSIAMGQADGTLIEFPNGHIMVIDIGSELGKDNNAGKDRMLPYLKSLGIRHIDTLVVTHGDYDHVAGILPVIAQISVGEVWINRHHTDQIPAWEGALRLNHFKTHAVDELDRRRTIGGVDVDILWPRPEYAEILEEQGLLNENESSVVIRLVYNQFSAIFMGDAGTAVEEQLIARYPIKPVSVLKAGHHGSNSASSQSWVDVLKPRAVMFSVGKHNRYHFPHQPVQDRFERMHSTIYRTDRDGTVRFLTDGYKMRVETRR